jgi:hypothetical protein
MNAQHPPKQINVELGEKESEGIYSNLALITHSSAEFIIDFTRMVPNVPKTKVYARIIMTPQHTKSLLKALQENVAKFEEQYGEIKLFQDSKASEIGFKPSTES